MKRRKEQQPALANETSIQVRFSEVDSMRVVWHGEYLRYLEDGRESFGKQYGLGYMHMVNQGYVVPIVELDIQYKQFLGYGETVKVETRYMLCEAAKILFEYILYKESDGSVVATASTTQVFVNQKTGLLELNNPEFYVEWKRKWNLL